MKNIVLYSEDLAPLTIISLSADEYNQLNAHGRLMRKFVRPYERQRVLDAAYARYEYARQLSPQAFTELYHAAFWRDTGLDDLVSERVNSEQKPPELAYYQIKMFNFNCDALGEACIRVAVIDRQNWEIAQAMHPKFTSHQREFLKDQHDADYDADEEI